MQITLDEGYNAMCDFVYLGYVGEVNAREISVLNYAIPEATAYKLKIEYPDKTVYELPIKNGMCSLGASIFKTTCEVKCQIVAYAIEGEVYKLVRKSDIFKQEIRSSIDESGIPSYEESLDALDKILQYESNSKEYAERAEQARDTAVSAKERAVSAENTTVQKADEADKSAQSAKNSEQNAAKSAERAESVAEVATASANQARDYAKEAAKAATNAGLSADTAEQAASRAETAKTSAETSATQAEIAKQGAETARAEAVKSQNSAKVSAAQAATSAQQTEADKTITAGYAKTAKTNADSTAADRQAVQDMATQVTADKATVADHAAQVAEDRTAAETAAQTAQAVADSLPEDYTTAVGKIAENTAEIANVKLTDKELQRRVNALYDLGQGITHKFETDSNTAYAKTIPTGGKLMSVKNVGGRSIVFNQMVDLSKSKETTADGVTFTFSGDGIVALNGTSNKEGNSIAVAVIKNMKDHKYLIIASPLSNVYGVGQLLFTSQVYGADTTGHGAIIVNGSSNATWYYTLYLYNGVTYDNVKLQPQIFDLTTMFGAGNEPSTVEEFEKMFPNDYYPYCAGEIVSAGTEEVVEQGANLCDPKIFSAAYPDRIAVKDDIIDVFSGNQAMFESGVALKIPQGYSIAFFPIAKENATTINGRIRALFSDGSVSDICYITDGNGQVKSPSKYAVIKDISAIAFNWSAFVGGFAFKMQITQNATDSFVPYHRNTYPIPEAVKSLPGYGWSAGTARNYVDYENKRYVQCVNSVDLGTLTWEKGESVSFKTHHLAGQKLQKNYDIAPNFMCPRYSAKTQNESWGKTSIPGISATSNVGGWIYVNDTSYTDVTTFKQAMSGVILYYELVTPIVTDISTLIDDDFLRNIEVEAGGSITFKNGNDSYRIPVPSEEEYIVKLSEVGGTT